MSDGFTEQQANERNCYLTTVGRVTGNPHEIEIWFAVEPESGGRTIYMLSGGRDRSDWVRNIRHNPSVRLRVGETTYQGNARIVVSGDPLNARARRIVAAKYQGWEAGQELSQWARESLVVTIGLDGLA